MSRRTDWKRRSSPVRKLWSTSFDSAALSVVEHCFWLLSFYFARLEHPLERFRRRLHVLFNLCANAWLHMFDIMLPMAIVRVQKSFLLDDDHEDFETGSILRHYLKDDQIKIKRKIEWALWYRSFIFLRRGERRSEYWTAASPTFTLLDRLPYWTIRSECSRWSDLSRTIWNHLRDLDTNW